MLLELSIEQGSNEITHTPAVDKGEVLMGPFEKLALEIHQKASDGLFPIIWYTYP